MNEQSEVRPGRRHSPPPDGVECFVRRNRNCGVFGGNSSPEVTTVRRAEKASHLWRAEGERTQMIAVPSSRSSCRRNVTLCLFPRYVNLKTIWRPLTSRPRPRFFDSESSSQLPSILRSEEHTSELQSRLHLVCRLLLEKKKK